MHGEVLESRPFLMRRHRTSTPLYTVSAAYVYVVNGQSFFSTRVGVVPAAASPRLADVVDPLFNRRPLIAHVNPRRPAQAVLVPGLQRDVLTLQVGRALTFWLMVAWLVARRPKKVTSRPKSVPRESP